ncbi:hypothetical protein [Marinomonas foliarum]|uniref:Uncharacterized protein n=1 Tax=Marinomonas foliarum TaxID=491950 RepID=A0A368ZW94_9GAMM|nr:hypothetical protein [Marinomonas foliarum]RCX01292.1 hypothetical protein DFP77_11772 [Marinomonas foliarum]
MSTAIEMVHLQVACCIWFAVSPFYNIANNRHARQFSSIFEVVSANEEEARTLKAQAKLIAVIRDLVNKNGWSHIEVSAEGSRVMIKQAKSQVNNNGLSEAKLLAGLDSYTAHADELLLNVDYELAESLIEQLNELDLPFIVVTAKRNSKKVKLVNYNSTGKIL